MILISTFSFKMLLKVTEPRAMGGGWRRKGVTGGGGRFVKKSHDSMPMFCSMLSSVLVIMPTKTFRSTTTTKKLNNTNRMEPTEMKIPFCQFNMTTLMN